MSKLMCTPDGYREALSQISSDADPIKRLLRFYNEKMDMRKGRTVFQTQFLPFIEKYICERERSLEIGYGPGSLMAEAGKHFRETWGIDVHTAKKLVGGFLEMNNCKNYKLLISPDGMGIPTKTNNIDFIYSWTVFMHLGNPEVARNYLFDSYSILKDGGLAVIYFARMYRSKKHETKDEWRDSIAKENSLPLYRVKEAKVQKINLTMSMRLMEEMAQSAGFKVLEKTASTRAVHAIEYYHGQHGLVLRKEEVSSSSTAHEGVSVPYTTPSSDKERSKR